MIAKCTENVYLAQRIEQGEARKECYRYRWNFIKRGRVYEENNYFASVYNLNYKKTKSCRKLRHNSDPFFNVFGVPSFPVAYGRVPDI